MKILVTGAAGFIGMHCAQRLLARGDDVLGVDDLNDYYDVRLKEARLRQLSDHRGFRFFKCNIADQQEIQQLIAKERPRRVLHLAAQPGVRYSLANPGRYVESNLAGFANVLEGCRHASVEHLVFASSSSVYGSNARQPFSVHDNVDHPVSLYAATKKSNELMAHAYAHLFGLPATGLRYFTVYGPWGRPDMAPFLFTRAILEGRPIDVFNNGRMRRDFTYVDDIAQGTLQVLDRAAAPDPAFDPRAPDPGTSSAPWRIYNIGNHEPVELLHFVGLLEEALGRKAVKNMAPMQPGDVAETFADVEALERATGFRPKTTLAEGVRRFVEWYRSYYKSV
ncbi:MAG TPA: NAD-dependent epimerase [Burkholderiales bacterium]|nr:NAD-dependent epimerase [Burkholderiales bacterium]